CGPSAKEREIRPLRREGVLASVNAAPDVCESECADHSLADAIPLERGERAVWRCGLGAVVEFQPADGQRMSGAGALWFETDVCLLEKQGRVVRAAAIRGKVGCAQPELSLRSCQDRIVGQVNDDWKREVDLPIELRLRLGERDAADGGGVDVLTARI